MARPRDEDRIARRKEFVRLLSNGVPPHEAARLSGHPCERALETLAGLGFTLSVLDGRMDVAA